MFEHHSEELFSNPCKTINFIANGNPNKSFKNSFQNVSKKDIFQAIETNWGIRSSKIRLFSKEGVQYYTQDIEYIRDKQNIYVSRGEQFDSVNNFSQYQIIKELGEGGFGKVSLAKNRNTNQLVAIKIIKPNRLNSAQDIDMIFRESQNMKALKHPHIVKIINCYTLKQMQMVIVMEYMNGGELLDLLKKKKKFCQQQSKIYFKQLISAVNYCHQRNIIHRDLKLQNILLTSNFTKNNKIRKYVSLKCNENQFDDEKNCSTQIQVDQDHNGKILKVTDFGISGVADNVNKQIDTGTLKYMAPQVLDKKQKTNTTAVDVWACGVILFYMVAGYLPFDNLPYSQLTMKIIKGEYKIPIDLSEQCKSLISKMLTVDPKKRCKIWEVEQDVWLNGNSLPQLKLLQKDIDKDEILEKYQKKMRKRQSIKTYVQTNLKANLNLNNQLRSKIKQKCPPIGLLNAHSVIQCKIKHSLNGSRETYDNDHKDGKINGGFLRYQKISSISGKRDNKIVGFKPVVPKRLEKQKLQIAEELKGYHQNIICKKKIYKSQFKPLSGSCSNSVFGNSQKDKQEAIIQDKSINRLQLKKKSSCLSKK